MNLGCRMNKIVVINMLFAGGFLLWRLSIQVIGRLHFEATHQIYHMSLLMELPLLALTVWFVYAYHAIERDDKQLFSVTLKEGGPSK